MRTTTLSGGSKQSMAYQASNCNWQPIDKDLVGKQKGMKRALQQRGLRRDGLKKQCERQKMDSPARKALCSGKGAGAEFGERILEETKE